MNVHRDGGSWWRRPFAASGILRIKSGLMPRPPASPPRRKLPRPTLAFNLALLAVGTLAGVVAILHRRSLDTSLAEFLARTDSAPLEIKRIRSELADRELDEKALSRELDARLEYARDQQMQEFYILLDTSRPRLLFKYGDRVLREAAVEVGAPRSIETRSGKTWTFAPVTGAF